MPVTGRGGGAERGAPAGARRGLGARAEHGEGDRRRWRWCPTSRPWSTRRPNRRWPSRRCPGRAAGRQRGAAAATMVSLMPVAQAEAAALLLASPAEEAYHQ